MEKQVILQISSCSYLDQVLWWSECTLTQHHQCHLTHILANIIGCNTTIYAGIRELDVLNADGTIGPIKGIPGTLQQGFITPVPPDFRHWVTMCQTRKVNKLPHYCFQKMM